MFKNLLFAAVFATAVSVAHANIPVTFSSTGVAVLYTMTPYVSDDPVDLVYFFNIPDPDGVLFSGQVVGLKSDLVPYGSQVISVTLAGAGSYVFGGADNFFTLSGAFLPQGDWTLTVPVVTAPLGGTVFALLSVTPVVSDVPEPGTLSLLLAGIAASTLVLRERLRRS